MSMKGNATIRRAALAASLRRTAIFEGLPEAELLRIADYSEVRPLARGEMLFHQGDPVAGFFVLLRGTIQVFRRDDEGREQLIHLFHPGDSFAEPAVAGLPAYPADARAVRASEVVLVRRDPFLDHQREKPDLAMRMLASLSRHLHSLVTAIDHFKSRDAETRLIHWLVRRCGEHDDRVEIRLVHPKSVLAAELGTRPETLSRIFARLRGEGLIEVARNAVVVRDPAALKARFERQLGPEP